MKAIIYTVLIAIILLSILIGIAYIIVNYEKIALISISAIALFLFAGIIYSKVKDSLE